jgi:diguanylate cyclase (GGDEF)-like protein
MTGHSDDLMRLAAAMRAAGDVGYEWNLTTDEIAWAGDAAALFGAGSHHVATGEALHGRLNAEDLPVRLKMLARHYRSEGPLDLEYRVRQPDGSFCWIHDRGQAVFGEDGAPLRMLGVLRRINRRKAYEAQVALSANFDRLTGHFNRARLRDTLQQGIAHAMRYHGSGAFLLVDIDRLGEVNDRYGYAAADSVIVAVGERIERALRASDTVGRVNGDVFGIVLDQCDEAEVEGVAQKLLSLFREAAVETVHGPIPVTLSIGGACYPDWVKTAYEATSRAEAALAEAKRLGRDTFVRYMPDERERELHRRSLEIGEGVKAALRRDDFAIAFQPIVEAETGRVRLYERLLRMVKPDGALVSAGEFMPAVERLGMTRLIDRRVLEMVVEELIRHPGIRLAMNISGFTATDRSWLRTLVALLKDRPRIAERLAIEITETAAIQDLEETARFIATVKDLGCEVALDDFGAGHISFRHVKSLTVDVVKIDGSFVRGLASRPDNLAFIRSLIALARNFGLETVAECVEDEADAQALRREGITMLQGWHYGKPTTHRPWLQDAPLAEPAG